MAPTAIAPVTFDPRSFTGPERNDIQRRFKYNFDPLRRYVSGAFLGGQNLFSNGSPPTSAGAQIWADEVFCQMVTAVRRRSDPDATVAELEQLTESELVAVVTFDSDAKAERVPPPFTVPFEFGSFTSAERRQLQRRFDLNFDTLRRYIDGAFLGGENTFTKSEPITLNGKNVYADEVFMAMVNTARRRTDPGADEADLFELTEQQLLSVVVTPPAPKAKAGTKKRPKNPRT